jgi:hypothetical protein
MDSIYPDCSFNKFPGIFVNNSNSNTNLNLNNNINTNNNNITDPNISFNLDENKLGHVEYLSLNHKLTTIENISINDIACGPSSIALVDIQGRLYFYNDEENLYRVKIDSKIKSVRFVNLNIYALTQEDNLIYEFDLKGGIKFSLKNYTEKLYSINEDVTKNMTMLDLPYYTNLLFFLVECDYTSKEKVEKGRSKILKSIVNNMSSQNFNRQSQENFFSDEENNTTNRFRQSMNMNITKNESRSFTKSHYKEYTSTSENKNKMPVYPVYPVNKSNRKKFQERERGREERSVHSREVSMDGGKFDKNDYNQKNENFENSKNNIHTNKSNLSNNPMNNTRIGKITNLLGHIFDKKINQINSQLSSYDNHSHTPLFSGPGKKRIQLERVSKHDRHERNFSEGGVRIININSGAGTRGNSVSSVNMTDFKRYSNRELPRSIKDSYVNYHDDSNDKLMLMSQDENYIDDDNMSNKNDSKRKTSSNKFITQPIKMTINNCRSGVKVNVNDRSPNYKKFSPNANPLNNPISLEKNSTFEDITKKLNFNSNNLANSISNSISNSNVFNNLTGNAVNVSNMFYPQNSDEINYNIDGLTNKEISSMGNNTELHEINLNYEEDNLENIDNIDNIGNIGNIDMEYDKKATEISEFMERNDTSTLQICKQELDNQFLNLNLKGKSIEILTEDKNKENTREKINKIETAVDFAIIPSDNNILENENAEGNNHTDHYDAIMETSLSIIPTIRLNRIHSNNNNVNVCNISNGRPIRAQLEESSNHHSSDHYLEVNVNHFTVVNARSPSPQDIMNKPQLSDKEFESIYENHETPRSPQNEYIVDNSNTSQFDTNINNNINKQDDMVKQLAQSNNFFKLSHRSMNNNLSQSSTKKNDRYDNDYEEIQEFEKDEGDYIPNNIKNNNILLEKPKEEIKNIKSSFPYTQRITLPLDLSKLKTEINDISSPRIFNPLSNRAIASNSANYNKDEDNSCKQNASNINDPKTTLNVTSNSNKPSEIPLESSKPLIYRKNRNTGGTDMNCFRKTKTIESDIYKTVEDKKNNLEFTENKSDSSSSEKVVSVTCDTPANGLNKMSSLDNVENGDNRDYGDNGDNGDNGHSTTNLNDSEIRQSNKTISQVFTKKLLQSPKNANYFPNTNRRKSKLSEEPIMLNESKSDSDIVKVKTEEDKSIPNVTIENNIESAHLVEVKEEKAENEENNLSYIPEEINIENAENIENVENVEKTKVIDLVENNEIINADEDKEGNILVNGCSHISEEEPNNEIIEENKQQETVEEIINLAENKNLITQPIFEVVECEKDNTTIIEPEESRDSVKSNVVIENGSSSNEGNEYNEVNECNEGIDENSNNSNTSPNIYYNKENSIPHVNNDKIENVISEKPMDTIEEINLKFEEMPSPREQVIIEYNEPIESKNEEKYDLQNEVVSIKSNGELLSNDENREILVEEFTQKDEIEAIKENVILEEKILFDEKEKIIMTFDHKDDNEEKITFRKENKEGILNPSEEINFIENNLDTHEEKIEINNIEHIQEQQILLEENSFSIINEEIIGINEPENQIEKEEYPIEKENETKIENLEINPLQNLQEEREIFTLEDTITKEEEYLEPTTTLIKVDEQEKSEKIKITPVEIVFNEVLITEEDIPVVVKIKEDEKSEEKSEIDLKLIQNNQEPEQKEEVQVMNYDPPVEDINKLVKKLLKIKKDENSRNAISREASQDKKEEKTKTDEKNPLIDLKKEEIETKRDIKLTNTLSVEEKDDVISLKEDKIDIILNSGIEVKEIIIGEDSSNRQREKEEDKFKSTSKRKSARRKSY